MTTRLVSLTMAAALLLYPLSLLAQGISASFSSTPLATAIKSVCDKSGYHASFNGDEMGKYTVTCSLSESSIEEAMAKVLEGKPYTYRVDGKQVIISKKAPQTQSKQQDAGQVIKGKVVDEKGEPLPGANVILKGGAYVGSATDANGNFSLGLGKGQSYTLIITFLGYKERIVNIAATNRDVVTLKNIKLEPDDNNLSDVVVNGVFTRNANTFTGAVSTISADQLKTIGNQNILQSLKNLDPSMIQVENLSAGSDPNALPDFQMRGSSTISSVQGEYASSANQPLFILDGFETALTKIMDLDMNQVKSVTLLKDATAKAIYGSKAANGVIVVETIRPESGKIRVTYNGSMSIEAPDLSSYDLCNATEKLEVEKLAGLFTDQNNNYVNQIALNNTYSSKLAEIIAGSYTDWKAQPTRIGVGQKHSVYVEGGDQAMQYGVNLMYNKIAGVMKGSDRNTFSGGVQLSYRWKSLQFRNKLTIDYNNSDNSPYGTFNQYTLMNPYSRLYDDNGDLIKSYNYSGTTGSITSYNPLYNTTLNTVDNSTYTNITNNFYAEWQALENVKVTARFGFVHQTSTEDLFKPANHTDFITTSDVFSKGSYNQVHGANTDISADLGVNWSKEFGKHLIFLNGQLSMTNNTYNTVGVEAVGFPNDFMDDISYAVQYAKNSKPTGTEGISRTAGGLASLNYSYDERYLFDANYRLTGSSETSDNHRWGSFWSVGAGWNVHNEAFLKEAYWLNRFKIRGSFGYTGSQGFNSYDALATFTYYSQQSYNGSIGSYIKRLANNNLHWQEKFDTNVGFDFGLFNNRLTGRFDYYISTTDGMITNVTVPYTTGFSTYVANLGKVENKGYEIYLNWRAISRARDYMNVFASLASNKNTLKEISNSLRAWNSAQDAAMLENKTTTPSVKYYEGCSMNAIWAVPSLGIDPQNGKEIFVKKDGTTTYDYDIADQVVCGDKMPKFNGTIGINGEYKCFGFSVTGSYRWGGQMYNTTLVEKVENCNIAYNVDRRVLTDRWNAAGDIARFKSIGDRSTTYPTSRFIEDYNLFTLSSLSLYYDFRDCNFVKNSFLERLRVTAYTNDLFNISSVKIERGTSYPFARTFSLSVQATF